MRMTLKNRPFLKELDFSKEEFLHLIRLAKQLKKAKSNGYERQRLKGKNIALIFEKSSTRTRSAFEVAAHDQGAHVTYLGPGGTHIGEKESMKDSARVLGRMYDGIQYRGHGQDRVETLARYAGVPVWNGLTDDFHPTQMLADVLTMMEHSDKDLENISYCYVGDARNNMGNSLMITGCLLGMDVRICAPKTLQPEAHLISEAKKLAKRYGARLTITDDVATAVKNVDYVHTDVWVSMGEPTEVWDERIQLLKPYQVNKEMIALTENKKVKFMHCLPAFHNRETEIGEEIFQKTGLDCLEVTEDVFEAPYSIVFDQAENRLHTIKAVIVATLES